MAELVPDLNFSQVQWAAWNPEQAPVPVGGIMPVQKPADGFFRPPPVKVFVGHVRHAQIDHHFPEPLTGAVTVLGVGHQVLLHPQLPESSDASPQDTETQQEKPKGGDGDEN